MRQMIVIVPYFLFVFFFSFLPVTESEGQSDPGKKTLKNILRQNMLGSEVGKAKFYLREIKLHIKI